MNKCFVDCEGAPLLLMDATEIHAWSGIDGDDYQRACSCFDNDPSSKGCEVLVGDKVGVLWDMGGAGTAFAIQTNSSDLVIVRGWFSAGAVEYDALSRVANEIVSNGNLLGRVDIKSGMLVVLCSTENGECVRPEDLRSGGNPSGTMAFKSGGQIIKMQQGRYLLLHDEKKNADGVFRRCHVKLDRSL